ncbi:PREDICTED: B- and T-lymphocyte attenuator isoform X1 [Propithecus coquereli]|uniref:B and T lymphocyte associated n=1 Tax=Propithecus coquereli TaxID=379532 RepID=A0A2K6GHX2_PROCO|nr:PREDICTED: B- and T-lymphocyte attenuator isoform X1 [Propithecus coquereli]
MKTLPAMLGIGKLFWVLFLSPHPDIWSIHGGESCDVQLYIKRQSVHSVSAGEPFKLECPVKYCDDRPNVTWCKLKGSDCLGLRDRFQPHTSWKEDKNISVFILHFEPVSPSDNGSYRCFVNLSSKLITSHSTTIYVTDSTSASGRPSKEEMANTPWLLYSLLPLGGLLLLITCFCLFYCLRRHQGKQKKLSDTARRDINMVDVPQPFKSEQTEEGTGQNSQTLPSETGIYDNDPETWFRMQEGSEVYSQPHLEENKHGIVYASLNHSIIGTNPRQARNVQETPTEYASICVRS